MNDVAAFDLNDERLQEILLQSPTEMQGICIQSVLSY